MNNVRKKVYAAAAGRGDLDWSDLDALIRKHCDEFRIKLYKNILGSIKEVHEYELKIHHFIIGQRQDLKRALQESEDLVEWEIDSKKIKKMKRMQQQVQKARIAEIAKLNHRRSADRRVNRPQVLTSVRNGMIIAILFIVMKTLHWSLKNRSCIK